MQRNRWLWRFKITLLWSFLRAPSEIVCRNLRKQEYQHTHARKSKATNYPCSRARACWLQLLQLPFERICR